MTVALTLYPLHLNEKPPIEGQPRIGLPAGFRPVAVYAWEGTAAGAGVPGSAGSSDASDRV
ncbi:hypothetical protein Pstu01_19600 [Stutzerimonas stutzeri]|nr:hypothetical protein Pstu01_19600 [Stutzerimonas stutzeri]